MSQGIAAARANPCGEVDSATKPVASTSEALTQEMLLIVEAGGIIHARHFVDAFMGKYPVCDQTEKELREMTLRIAVSRSWPIEFGD